jgi:hypothetical protein
MQGRIVMTLQNLAVLNAPPRYLLARPNNDGFAIVRPLGRDWVKDGDFLLDDAVLYAQRVLDNDPAALADRDGRLRLAACLVGIFASASLSLNEQGKAVSDVQGPA